MKIRLFILALFAAFLFFAIPTGQIVAAKTCESFRIEGQNDIFAIPSDTALTFKFDLSDSQPAAYDPNGSFTAVFSSGPNKSAKAMGGIISFTQAASTFSAGKTYTIKLNYDPPTGNLVTICTRSFGISATESGNCTITVNPPAPSVRDTLTVNVKFNATGNYNLYHDGAKPGIEGITNHLVTSINADKPNILISNYGISNNKFYIAKNRVSSKLCERSFQVTENGGGMLESQFTDLCSFAQGEGRSQCTACIGGSPPGIWTAIGCISSTPSGFVKTILPFAMGLGGGIAFLLMLIGALQIMTSAGNPEKLNAGKELVTSAIVGLLLIIFSVFLLKLIGADILGVPGFK